MRSQNRKDVPIKKKLRLSFLTKEVIQRADRIAQEEGLSEAQKNTLALSFLIHIEFVKEWSELVWGEDDAQMHG